MSGGPFHVVTCFTRASKGERGCLQSHAMTTEVVCITTGWWVRSKCDAHQEVGVIGDWLRVSICAKDFSTLSASSSQRPLRRSHLSSAWAPPERRAPASQACPFCSVLEASSFHLPEGCWLMAATAWLWFCPLWQLRTSLLALSPDEPSRIWRQLSNPPCQLFSEPITTTDGDQSGEFYFLTCSLSLKGYYNLKEKKAC